uniref:Uncharacterized protein n=1 Tax=Anguilla anguilla TaxID=7936 RepID=A0A0E9WGP0_ANGAN
MCVLFIVIYNTDQFSRLNAYQCVIIQCLPKV